jgi:hypothetical protein
MKKLLGIVVLGLLLSGNANALIDSCKSYLNGEIILNDAYDLEEGSSWDPEYSDTYIFWSVFKMTSGEGTSSKAIVVYNKLNRYSGDLVQRISYDDYVKTHLKKNRRNASIDYVLNGSCTKGKKKKF